MSENDKRIVPAGKSTTIARIGDKYIASERKVMWWTCDPERAERFPRDPRKSSKEQGVEEAFTEARAVIQASGFPCELLLPLIQVGEIRVLVSFEEQPNAQQ
jgi:hypothetical protein